MTRFRWQVVPACLTAFCSFCVASLGLLFVAGWFEYVGSDRYDPNRGLLWSPLEFSVIGFCFVSAVFFMLSAKAWLRTKSANAITYAALGGIVLILGFTLRIG